MGLQPWVHPRFNFCSLFLIGYPSLHHWGEKSSWICVLIEGLMGNFPLTVKRLSNYIENPISAPVFSISLLQSSISSTTYAVFTPNSFLYLSPPLILRLFLPKLSCLWGLLLGPWDCCSHLSQCLLLNRVLVKGFPLFLRTGKAKMAVMGMGASLWVGFLWM